MRKIVTIFIISLFVITSFIEFPGIYASSNANKLNLTDELKNNKFSNKHITRGNPPLPPVMWTDDFLNFYISVPQNPDADQIYYFIDWGDGTNSAWTGPYEPGETVYLSHVWTEEGTYKIKIKAKDDDGESKYTYYILALHPDFKFFGVETGYVDITYIFSIYLKQYEYFILIDWGDENLSGWLGPYYEGIVLFSYAWSFPGEYLLKIKMKDIYGNESDWLELLIITILTLDNNAPQAPVIAGPPLVSPGTHEWTFKAIDPDGDNISYFIEWGDGSYDDWFGWFASGEEIILSHNYHKYGRVSIRARAKDTNGAISDWSEMKVIIPKSTQQYMTSLFFQLLNR